MKLRNYSIVFYFIVSGDKVLCASQNKVLHKIAVRIHKNKLLKMFTENVSQTFHLFYATILCYIDHHLFTYTIDDEGLPRTQR